MSRAIGIGSEELISSAFSTSYQLGGKGCLSPRGYGPAWVKVLLSGWHSPGQIPILALKMSVGQHSGWIS